MSKTARRVHDGWSVQAQWPNEDPFLCGPMFWAWSNGDARIPYYLEACKTAVFRTRKDARRACKIIKLSRNKARVVKVQITISVKV